MFNLPRNHLLISVVLFIYTLLLVVPLHRFKPAPSSEPLISPLFGTMILFVLVLFIVLRLHDAQNRGIIYELKKRLATEEKAKSEVEQGYQQQMEKKLFEIGIINAALNREIAERMQAETESRELHKQMELILNSAGEGIFGLDIDGNVTFINTAAALMTGWKGEEIINRSHHELVHHSYPDGSPHPPELCLINQACKDGVVHFSSDDFFWTSEGTSFPVEYVSTPIIDDDRLCGAVVVFRDKSTFT